MACVKVYHFQDEVVRGCSFPLPSVSALSQMTCSWGACESPSRCCSITQPRPTLRNPTTAAHQASLPFTISQTLLKFMSIQSVMLSDCLILCCPLLLLPSVFPSIRVFSNELALRIRWPKHWSVTFSISPSSEYSGLISFKID